MKRTSILVALAMWTVPAHADSLGGSYFFSTDTDGNDIHQQTLDGWRAVSEALDIGASLGRTSFKQSGRHSTRGALRYDFREAGFASRGDIGLERLGGRSFVTGDMVVETYRGAWTLAAGLERALVDSEQGIDQGLSATTAYALADWSREEHGAAVILSRTAYTDNNSRNRLRTRLWKSVCDCGLSVQLATESYSNSRPYTGNYFSPDRYDRVLGGIGVRHRTPHGVFSGRAEYGVQRVDGEQQPSHTITASFESARQPGGWQWRVEFIHDRKQPGYTYTQGYASLIKRF